MVPDLTDFPFSPENAIVKVATPEMALNPLFDPNAVPSDQPPCSSTDQSDPWYVPQSMNLQSNLVVRNGIVFGYHSTTPSEVGNFFANGNTHALSRCRTTTLEVRLLGFVCLHSGLGA